MRKRLKPALSNRLAVDPEGYGTPLRGALTGFWKREFASHRVIYRIYPDTTAIVVCAVGKRQRKQVADVYKQLEPLVKAGKIAEQIRAVMERETPTVVCFRFSTCRLARSPVGPDGGLDTDAEP